jgi:hypothetical protein
MLAWREGIKAPMPTKNTDQQSVAAPKKEGQRQKEEAGGVTPCLTLAAR